MSGYNINKVRNDFPILSREVYGKPLVYLDNAATTQKPLCVLDAMREEYLNVNANVHRGVHYLSQQATDLHEAAREKVRQFVNATKTEEIVFTRGTTEAINLVASSFCESQMQEGDEVLVTEMEHHSNIVSWPCQQCVGDREPCGADYPNRPLASYPCLGGWCSKCATLPSGCAGYGL